MVSQTERHLSYAAAARTRTGLDGTGKSVHSSTIFRWVTRGVLVNGQRIFLEKFQVGGRACTSVEALARFDEACERARRGEQVAVPQAPASSGHEAAEKFLAECGM